MAKPKVNTDRNRTRPAQGAQNGEPTGIFANRGTRELIESVAIALILAFLFRAFEAEAFVIPTGSMAPTLKGQHKDIDCAQCKHRFATGVRTDADTNRVMRINAVICPICRFINELDPSTNRNDADFSGDRILVNKFAYDIASPERWDVIVFKFPGDAKTNYIKRLIGLPGETIRIFHGDIYTKNKGETEFHIARKPPHKLLAMLQTVDDTNHIPPTLVQAKWPARWQSWTRGEGFSSKAWNDTAGDGRSFEIAGEAPGEAWLRYQHIFPTRKDWEMIVQGKPGVAAVRPITDFTTYNCGFTLTPDMSQFDPSFSGRHWVGDLGMEASLKVEGPTGQVKFKLVEAGRHYECSIDLADGAATLSIDGGEGEFATADGGAKAKFPLGKTPIAGAGEYPIRFTNVDNELRFWVNGRLVEFDGPTTYSPSRDEQPTWSESEPGDMSPLGIGANKAALKVANLRVFRDVYYIADNFNRQVEHDYDRREILGQREMDVLDMPGLWRTSKLFKSRRALDLTPLESDQFLPLGDNSAASSDARLWIGETFVRRDLLIGKAFVVYFPHTWNSPIPLFTPNPSQMRLIR